MKFRCIILIKELQQQVYHFQLTLDIMLKCYKQPLNHTHLYKLSDQRVPGSNNNTSTIYENNDGHVVHLSSFYFQVVCFTSFYLLCCYCMNEINLNVGCVCFKIFHEYVFNHTTLNLRWKSCMKMILIMWVGPPIRIQVQAQNM